MACPIGEDEGKKGMTKNINSHKVEDDGVQKKKLLPSLEYLKYSLGFIMNLNMNNYKSEIKKS